MKASTIIGTVMATALIVAGCATVTTGTGQLISVSSNVDGADVYLDGEKVGTTPFTGSVPKNKETLRVEADGYRSETLSLSKTLEPMFWGNIIIGGTLGSITDFATGAAYQYAPSSYQVELRESGQQEQAFHQQLVVRKFAMVYIDQIASDVAAGGGEYLSALTELISPEGSVTASSIAAALEESGGDPILFGHGAVHLR